MTVKRRVRNTLFILSLGFAAGWYCHIKHTEGWTLQRIVDTVKEKAESLLNKTPQNPQESPSAASNQHSRYVATPDKQSLAGLPVSVSGRNLTILRNSSYTAGYDDALKNPAWVAYTIEGPFKYDKSLYKRPSRFKSDGRTRSLIAHDAYTHSGYDRGHMAPSSAIYLRFGRDAMAETYLMTNIIPQYHELNAGPWKNIEERVGWGRDNWGERLKQVWVTCGPIYDDDTYEKLPSGVVVPDACYKIIADIVESTGEVRMLAFIMPNTKNRTVLDKPLHSYIVAVDAVEQRADLDFFSELSDDIEDKLEATVPSMVWK